MKKKRHLDLQGEAVTSENEKKTQKSFFIYYLDTFFEFCYSLLFSGLFGRFFTCYTKTENTFEEGFINRTIIKNKGVVSFFRKIRKFLSRNFADSFIIDKLGATTQKLIAIPLRSYGNFCFSFGIYSILVYFINLLISGTAYDSTSLYAGLILCVISIPLIMSSSSLAASVYSSKITRFIFVRFFGFKEEAFSPKQHAIKYHSNIMIFLGMVLGMLTLVVSPIIIIGVIISFIAISLIVITPEIGVISSLFLLPFFSFSTHPTLILVALVLTTTLSYIIKVIRGKRILRFKLIDIFVIGFTVLIFLSGIISVGGSSSFADMIAACSLLLGYFLVVNLMRSTLWLERCIAALTSSAFIVALIGIFQYFLGTLETNTFDTAYFSDIKGRTVSLFENSNVLGNYLAIVLPFVLAQFIIEKGKYTKLLGFFSVVAMAVCAVFTWSRSAWIAIIISTLVFLFIYSRKTGRIFLFGALALPFASFLLPSNVISRFLSIGDLADSSTMYRVYIWKGTLRSIADHFWSGIGFGSGAFTEIYPQYAYAGIESAEHSHSLVLQILLSMGISGLIVFVFIIVLLFKQSLEYIQTPTEKSNGLFVAASFASIIAALIMGTFDYVWYNYRVFFIFWIVIAICSAYFRIKEDEERRKRTITDSRSFATDTEISL